MNTVIITGAAGFIGSHLTGHFLRAGDQVVAVDNLSSGRQKNLQGFQQNLQFIKADVTQPWTNWLDQVVVKGKITKVFHFASLASPPLYQEKPLDTLWVNSLGLSHALQTATAAGAHLTFASTSEVYGDPDQHPQTEDYRGNVNTYGPRACYDEAKRFGEAITMAYHRAHNVNTAIARIFNTYGSRMRPEDGRVIPNFFSQAGHKQPLTIYGDGKQTRSLCYVSDLVQGIYALMQSEVHEPINIGNPHEMTILDLAETVNKITGNTSKHEYKPLPPDDPKQRCPNIEKAKALLNWTPKISLEEGLSTTLEYFKEEQAR